MNNTVARAILTSFDAARPAPLAANADRSWRWTKGVHVFPEAVCPFCKVVMRSTCLWLVDERGQRLLQIVGFSGDKMVVMPRRHPHASQYDGVICMNGGSRVGKATSAAEALFLAIYPSSNMMTGNTRNKVWDKWFADYFGHTEHDAAGLKRRSRPKRLKVGRVDKTTAKATDKLFN